MGFYDTPDYSKLKNLLIEGLDMFDLDIDEEISIEKIKISKFQTGKF
jgi:hypothetical protein